MLIEKEFTPAAIAKYRTDPEIVTIRMPYEMTKQEVVMAVAREILGFICRHLRTAILEANPDEL